MAVHSVVFDKSRWSPSGAEKWLKANNHMGPPTTRLDESEGNTLRYRQKSDEYERYITAHPAGDHTVSLVLGMGRKKPRAEPEPIETPKGEWGIFNYKGETSDEMLDDWAKKNIEGFLGVKARSEIEDLYPTDRRMPAGSSCVLNLDPGDYMNGGTHWVCLRVATESPNVLFYDPFGTWPPREVSLRAKQDGLGVKCPDIQYQGLDETNCGPRCLGVLQHLAEKAKEGKEAEAFRELCQVDEDDDSTGRYPD